MTDDQPSRLDLGALLAAVEDAPPVDAAAVVGDFLADALGATDVSFLIADFSGGALIRLGHTGRSAAADPQERETAERVSLVDSFHGRALADQVVAVEETESGARLYAPVTNR